MKIQCQSCQAKYTIADEKVVGKVVKIRCKKCSATIVINGNEAQPQEDNADTNVFDYAQGGAGDPWTVNVADGDQRTMTPAEIVAGYKDGTVNDETYCWKDGMADWLPLREIDQLYGAIKLGPGLSLEEAPQSLPHPGAGAGGGALFSAEPAAAASSPFSAGNGNGGALFGGGAEAAQAAPAAARRASARGAGQDLFGNVEKAGGEDDVMTSAASGAIGAGGGGAAAAAGAEKMTGQRNENSVLFSLSALTSDAKSPEKSSSSSSSSSGGGENRTTATSDGSGLIDIRALSANMGNEGGERKDTNARVDDIMNLSGGGAFGAALAAPILAPPPLASEDLAALTHGGAPPRQSKTLIFAILGAGAFIAVAIVLAVVLTRPSPTTATGPTGSAMTDPSAGALAMNDPANPAGGANNATPPTTPGHEPPPPAVGNADKPTTVNPGAKAAPARPGAGAAAKAEPAAPAGEPAAAKPAAPSQPASFGDALAQAAGKPKEAPAAPGPAAGGAPFDRGAAAASLGAVNVQSCKKPDGPTGSGRVEVTFNPDGSAASANIIEGPFPGTPVGGCIAGKFRSARVPAFSGAPVHVKKSFTVN